METSAVLRDEMGPVMRTVASRYFEPVRFPEDAEAELRRLTDRGFVIHVMRTTSWINYLYLTWALIKRGLPPVRAVVNLRRWFTKPWRRAAQRGDFGVRFTYARRNGGSGLIFLKQSAFGKARGRNIKEDPFPALVEMARRADRPVYLVPELFAWEKWSPKLKPGVIDWLFGSPEAPGFVHTVLAFWRNYHRAQFRVGEPIDLRQFIEENATATDEVIARKVRGALYHHLARETRAVFGPPYKPVDRVIEETLRDRALRKTLDDLAAETKRPAEALTRETAKNLRHIAARLHPTVVAMIAPVLSFVFQRIYDGIEVDEAGLDRTMKIAARGPIVLCPSHKSHVDYLVLSWVLWQRGYTVPLVAAGANLAFWPLGPILRRAGGFFLRRSFRGDRIYTAAFKAYVKKLVHEGAHQEFFLEGGRSRTGKLLTPKLGLLTWEVDAVLEGARPDLYFVPVAIDYEKVVEGRSYSKELAGGDKKPESLRALLSTPKVLTKDYGRIHLTFDEPMSLADFIRTRGLSLDAALDDEQKKSLVRALGNRIMYGISRVSTVTPHALVSAALLAHRRRGITATELANRVALLRRIAEDERSPLSKNLRGAPSDPTIPGPIFDALESFEEDGMVEVHEAKGEAIYRAKDERRAEMSFYKNTLMNLIASRSLVANALLSGGERPSELSVVKQSSLFLSRLFKFEFVYRVGATFDTIFMDTVNALAHAGLVTRERERLAVSGGEEAASMMEFLSDLMRDFLEAYWITALTVTDIDRNGPVDRKAFIKAALETGRAEFLAGRLTAAESLSRTTVENALAFLVDQRILAEQDKLLVLGPTAKDSIGRDHLASDIRIFIDRRGLPVPALS